jgi:hypothetical protein
MNPLEVAVMIITGTITLVLVFIPRVLMTVLSQPEVVETVGIGIRTVVPATGLQARRQNVMNQLVAVVMTIIGIIQFAAAMLIRAHTVVMSQLETVETVGIGIHIAVPVNLTVIMMRATMILPRRIILTLHLIDLPMKAKK